MNCTHETTEFRRQRYRGYNCNSDWQKVNQCLICGERIPYSDKSPFWPEDYDNETMDLPAYDYKFLHKNDGKEIITEDLKLRNPSKVDLGMKNETQTRMAKANQNKRMRIFARDGARCVICGKTGADDALHVAHIISDHEGQGLSKKYSDFPVDFVYSDYNLFVCCSECNLGQGKESLAPKLAVFVAAVIRKNMEQN